MSLSMIEWERINFKHVLEHNQNTLNNDPLLSINESVTFVERSQFKDVNKHLSEADVNTETVDDTVNDQHNNILWIRNYCRVYTPEM